VCTKYFDNKISNITFAVALHPKSGIGPLSVEVYRSRRHTYPVRMLWTSDQLVAQTATNTTQQTQEANFHALSEIQTRDPNNRAAADPCLTPRAHALQLDENCALLWYDAEYRGNPLQTPRDKLSVPSSRITQDSWPLQMESKILDPW